MHLYVPLQKADFYEGPRGGKYADPEHKISWKEGQAREFPWKPSKGGGYELLGGKVKVQREGKVFVLKVEGIADIPLGKRATFDSANRALEKLFASGKSLQKAGPFVGPRGGLWADPQHKIHWEPAKHGTERLEAMLADLVPNDQVKTVATQLGKISRQQLKKLLGDVTAKMKAISARGEATPATLIRWKRILDRAWQRPELVGRVFETKFKMKPKPEPKPKKAEQLSFVMAAPSIKKPEVQAAEEAVESEQSRDAARSVIGLRAVKKLEAAGWMFEDVMPKTLKAASGGGLLNRAQSRKLKDAGIRVVPNPNAEPGEPTPEKPKPRRKPVKKKPVEKKPTPKVRAKKRGPREIKQTGEHIWGSRKDLAGMAVHTAEDLNGLTYEDAKYLVTKQRIVPPHDLELLRNMGQTAGAANMSLALVTMIGAKPPDTEAGRAAYIEEAREVLGSLKQVKDRDDFRTLMREMQHKRSSTQKWRDVPGLENVHGMEQARETRLKIENDNPGKNYGIRQDFGGGGGLRIVEEQVRPYDALGSRFVSFISMKGKNYQGAMNEAYRADAAPDGFAYLNDRGLEKEQQKAAKEKRKEQRRKKTGAGEVKRGWSTAKEVAGEIERKGQSIEVKTANEKRVRKVFNLREVDYGKAGYMTQADREYHTKALEGAFHDFSEVMGVDPEILSFSGRLGVAMGARGRGKAAAHYETGRHVINITKFRGGGTLAHEWAHALDNIMAAVFISKTGKASAHYLTDNRNHSALPPSVRKAINGVHDAMTKDPPEIAEQRRQEHRANLKEMNAGISKLIARNNEMVGEINKLKKKAPSEEARQKRLRAAEANIEQYQAEARKERKGTQAHRLAEFYVKHWKSRRDNWKDPSSILSVEEGKRISDLTLDVELLRTDINRERRTYNAYKSLPLGATDYARSGRILGKDYWGNNQEMLARAFEAYVQDKLEDNGRRNSYLVDGTRSGGVAGEAGLFTVAAYPMKAERKRINAAFEKLMSVLSEEKHLEKALRFIIALEDVA